ncbi:hypothetical protein FRACYDRAFT_243558 [Fragilariopsis cylindrus CCMP1102]|uniref:DUF6824 domain-containing protein n=1 Tax=Fragilariopsis cylindrus CCMP1102 TaxID=635003 RepID=A0A1E7F4D5_9STRA|nr:hypothetical protein FRACYDRAFT_243558 [Fragilariopsis cylindrus CCMP1102]|eukprot:OEU13041.1 hypothetical protein FRACYDRAFT_243558 [Fragilariopsis cylindrus CCMP1102]
MSYDRAEFASSKFVNAIGDKKDVQFAGKDLRSMSDNTNTNDAATITAATDSAADSIVAVAVGNNNNDANSSIDTINRSWGSTIRSILLSAIANESTTTTTTSACIFEEAERVIDEHSSTNVNANANVNTASSQRRSSTSSSPTEAESRRRAYNVASRLQEGEMMTIPTASTFSSSSIDNGNDEYEDEDDNNNEDADDDEYDDDDDTIAGNIAAAAAEFAAATPVTTVTTTSGNDNDNNDNDNNDKENDVNKTTSTLPSGNNGMSCIHPPPRAIKREASLTLDPYISPPPPASINKRDASSASSSSANANVNVNRDAFLLPHPRHSPIIKREESRPLSANVDKVLEILHSSGKDDEDDKDEDGAEDNNDDDTIIMKMKMPSPIQLKRKFDQETLRHYYENNKNNNNSSGAGAGARRVLKYHNNENINHESLPIEQGDEENKNNYDDEKDVHHGSFASFQDLNNNDNMSIESVASSSAPSLLATESVASSIRDDKRAEQDDNIAEQDDKRAEMKSVASSSDKDWKSIRSEVKAIVENRNKKKKLSESGPESKSKMIPPKSSHSLPSLPLPLRQKMKEIVFHTEQLGLLLDKKRININNTKNEEEKEEVFVVCGVANNQNHTFKGEEGISFGDILISIGNIDVRNTKKALSNKDIERIISSTARPIIIKLLTSSSSAAADNNNTKRLPLPRFNCDICNSPWGGESGRCNNVLACGIRCKRRAEEQKKNDKMQKVREEKKRETAERKRKETAQAYARERKRKETAQAYARNNRDQPAPSESAVRPNNQDVLLGRGKPVRNHNGNRKMAGLIVQYRRQYNESKNGQKGAIVEEILGILSTDGGRFLRRYNEDSTWWTEVPQQVAFKKVCDAFRSQGKIAKAEAERRRAEKEKIRDDKKQDVAAERKKMKMAQALAKKILQEQRKKMKMAQALAKKILQEQKKQEAVDWKEVDNLTKLSKDGITLSTGNHLWLDTFNTLRNEVKDFVEKSAGKPEGLLIAFAIDGTNMSSSGLFKFKIPNGEATANSILHQCEPIENCVYRNPNATTSSLQVVGEFTSKLPQPFLANRVAVAKTGTLFGKTIIARTDNLKVQKYKGPGGEHSDDKFKHIITKPLFGLPNKSLLLCRVLEKPDGGVLQLFREPDKKKFSIRIEKGELLIMMAHAGLCNHKCEKGLYTIVTDFVLPYDAHREMKITGGLKGKFEKFISDYATSISHL